MSLDERKLRSLHIGGMAEIALSTFEAEAENVKANLLLKVAQEYRAGTVTHDRLIATVASICALDDLLLSLKQKVTTANSIEKKESKNATDNPSNR